MQFLPWQALANLIRQGLLAPPQAKPATRWYHESYPVILAAFGSGSTHNAPPPTGVQDQVLRTLLVSAWIRKILMPDLNNRTLGTYLMETAQFRSLISPQQVVGLDLSPACSAASKLLNSGMGDNIASVSKLLHFDMPMVFPILDKKVANVLRDKGVLQQGRQGQPTGADYSRYIDCVAELASLDPQLWQSLSQLAAANGVPLLRVIDTALFL